MSRSFHNMALLGVMLLVGVCGSVTCCSAEAVSQQARAESPRNIILIMADDLGYHSLSAYGCDEFQTPNLDRLARSGMVFTQCHARAMCSPTRTVLLGGRTLDRASMGQVPSQSMAEVLAAEGLYCGFSGKWMQRNMPWNHGFAEGLVQVNWYKYYGPHFVVFNSGGYLREHNLPIRFQRI